MGKGRIIIVIVLECFCIQVTNSAEGKSVEDYQATVDSIFSILTKGKLKHRAYNRLAYLVDTFGPRPSGSESLERAIDYLRDGLTKDKLENVHTEPAIVPHWKRGFESAMLLSPRKKQITISSLGSSVGTPPRGIKAEAIVVKSFQELEERKKEVPGRIVVLNQPYIRYDIGVKMRRAGASKVSKLGGIATLIKSVTPLSIYSPHTGWQSYEKGVNPIPAASITVEDAEMLNRMQDRGDRIVLKIKMGAKNLKKKISRNTVAEIKGHEKPEEIVIISAHIDCWDICEGAMDDGAGTQITWEALAALAELNLRPRRTIRGIFYTAEEVDLAGAVKYYEDHKNESKDIVIAMEADEGVFQPLGIKFQGIKEAQQLMKQVMGLLAPYNATTLRLEDVNYGDTQFFINDGAPGAALLTKDSTYFYYHHTKGDTMSIVDADELDMSAGVWASLAYVIADMDTRIPWGQLQAKKDKRSKN